MPRIDHATATPVLRGSLVQAKSSTHGLTQVDERPHNSGTVEVYCRGSAGAPAVIIG
jgi:hypothetical protein